MYDEIDFGKTDLNSDPPAEEPARQYYFMEAARRRVQKLSGQKGRPLTFYVKTFGCQMNTVPGKESVRII